MHVVCGSFLVNTVDMLGLVIVIVGVVGTCTAVPTLLLSHLVFVVVVNLLW